MKYLETSFPEIKIIVRTISAFPLHQKVSIKQLQLIYIDLCTGCYMQYCALCNCPASSWQLGHVIFYCHLQLILLPFYYILLHSTADSYS